MYTLSSWVLLKLPFIIVIPYLPFDIVQSRVYGIYWDLVIALFEPGLLLKGATVASEFFIYFSDKSTFKPAPNWKKAPNDFLFLLEPSLLIFLLFWTGYADNGILEPLAISGSISSVSDAFSWFLLYNAHKFRNVSF